MHLLTIILELILTDIIFGGDNAVIIAMATKNLEPSLKKKASLLGALFAILLRIVFVIVILLLEEVHIYFINIIGGLFLLYIALSLVNNKEEELEVSQEKSLFKAVRTIVFADAIMSLDNVVVISIIVNSANVGMPVKTLLVIFALLISFPIILFGASILSKLIEKFKFIIYIMALLLIHVSLDTILKDRILVTNFTFFDNGISPYVLWILAIIILFLKFAYENSKSKNK